METKTAFRVYQAVTIVGLAMFITAMGILSGWPNALAGGGLLLACFGLMGSYLAYMARYHR